MNKQPAQKTKLKPGGHIFPQTRTTGISLILPLLIIIFFSCTTLKKEENYKTKNIYRGTVNSSIESGKSIDNGKTYEIYFRLNEKEKCLKFQVRSEKIGGYIDEKDKYLRSFFIIEKAVDISSFIEKTIIKSPEKTGSTVEKGQIIFSEITRNFNSQWKRQREIVQCSKKDDPIKKFDAALYRIRFTIFSNETFNYTITIFSNSKIQFFEKY